VRLNRTYASSQIHDRWEAMYRSNPLLDALNDVVMDRILRYTKPPVGAKVLDAGCGIGDHTARFARAGYNCLGIDISPAILEKANDKIRSLGLSSRVRFACQALEDLSLNGELFDVVHCRGVLMHIPDWKAALKHLCNALRPGGHIVVLENNARAPYSRAYLLMRSLYRHSVASRLVETEGGSELWTTEDGISFVARMANIDALNSALTQFGVVPLHRFATSLVGMELFPAGRLRNTAIRVNKAACVLQVPATICKGNAVIGRKR
jgi:2-polyprenyl-3-methyl-5-hydroxy-6-metoxy-1,4-benzoquinol methylase